MHPLLALTVGIVGFVGGLAMLFGIANYILGQSAERVGLSMHRRSST